MALTVEDGSGVIGADSYASLADAATYLADRGLTLWATDMTDAEREQALRRATDYMVQAYRSRWRGVRVLQGQALDWPRADVPREIASSDSSVYYPDNVLPDEVRNACIELAYRGASGPLMADVTRSQYTQREKVDVIEVEYFAWAPTQAAYRAVESMLEPFLSSASTGVARKIVRT